MEDDQTPGTRAEIRQFMDGVTKELGEMAQRLETANPGDTASLGSGELDAVLAQHVEEHHRHPAGPCVATTCEPCMTERKRVMARGQKIGFDTGYNAAFDTAHEAVMAMGEPYVLAGQAVTEAVQKYLQSKGAGDGIEPAKR